MARRFLRGSSVFDDSDWPEVKVINGYAVFMGYLTSGVNGLSFMIITWTTVVLLGGFVSVLGQKDFFCLTGITLVQTPGALNFLLREKLSDFVHSCAGMVAAVGGIIIRDRSQEVSLRRTMVVKVVSRFQMIMLYMVLCLVALVYVFGPYISAGVSMWRLVQHDFGNGDGGPNFKPALETVYVLAVVQGVLFGYRTIHAFVGAKIGLPKFMSSDLDKDEAKEVVSGYIETTIAGCEKDLSFATGRNLATYTVGLVMEAGSKQEFVAGIRVLGTVLTFKKSLHYAVLAKHLLTRSASSSHLIYRLLETLGPRSPYNREIKKHAAMIVELVAGTIRLVHFPQGIECISCLLDTFEEHSWRPDGYERLIRKQLPKEYERSWLLEEDEWCCLLPDPEPITERERLVDDELEASTSADEAEPVGDDDNNKDNNNVPSQSHDRYDNELVMVGLGILQKLAVVEDNCRVISSTQGLVSKIMAPLCFVELHSGDHGDDDDLLDIASVSLNVLSRLMAVPGETGAELQRQISIDKQNITRAVKSILGCLDCPIVLRKEAAEVLLLLHLSVDACLLMPGGTRDPIFIGFMLHIVLLPDDCFFLMCGSTHFAKKMSDVTRLALQHLLASLKSDTGTTMLQAVRVALGNLSSTIKGAENNARIINALSILTLICCKYSEVADETYRKEVEDAIKLDVKPEVLRLIVRWCCTRKEGTQAVSEANNGGNVLLAEGTDLEQGGVSPDNGQGSGSTPRQQKGEQDEGIKLQEALKDFCRVLHELTWIEGDQDLTSQLKEIAEIKKDQDLTPQLKEIVDEICKEEETSDTETICSAALDHFAYACAGVAFAALFAPATVLVAKYLYIISGAEWNPQQLYQLVPVVLKWTS